MKERGEKNKVLKKKDKKMEKQCGAAIAIMIHLLFPCQPNAETMTEVTIATRLSLSLSSLPESQNYNWVRRTGTRTGSRPGCQTAANRDDLTRVAERGTVPGSG